MNIQTGLPQTAELNFQSTRQLVNQLARLTEISVTLNSTLDLNALLKFIVHTATQVLDCEEASIMLYDDQRGELLFTASSNSAEELAQIPVPLEGSIAGTIFRENRALVIADVEKDPRHFAQVGEQIKFRPRSLLGVPMLVRDKVVGVLEGLNKRNGSFNQRDAYLLSIIASQAAVAINNSRLHAEIQTAYGELSRVDKIKSDFMAIASHELRTPLGVILGYATFLKEDAQGELSTHAEIVLNAALKLRSLVEEMTNMNLLRVGTLDLQKSAISIQQIIARAYEEISPTAKAKGQTVTLNLPPQPIIIHVDMEKIERVFSNILNNAVRFTPDRGEITITTFVKNNEVWAQVTDTGIGIPKEELKKIFQEFYQVEDHMTRRFGGMGLGLAIAKGVVDMHNGRIWAESDGIGMGATFFVVLPAPG
ncbi:MAG: GAF domain-containing protein [Anaerolineales bacterium]|nr:GAF domain-containing protein [Anaerolineales bacterium]